MVLRGFQYLILTLLLLGIFFGLPYIPGSHAPAAIGLQTEEASGAMFFHTFDYLVFFLIVFVTYWSLPWLRARIWLLVGASFYFYYQWSETLAFLVASTATLDYLLGRVIERSRRDVWRRFYLIFSLVMNLGILCYFKYANFFLDSLKEGLSRHGWGGTTFDALDVIVPFGISFYTFEAISYVVDVYRGKIKAERRLSHFLLFILFFPHLVSGPIVRAGDFLPQTYRPKRFNWLRMKLGVEFFLSGLIKKMAIADRMALFSDPVFANPSDFSTGAIWLGVIAFAIRIYCDFSGYSDMALGSAHMLGYKLTLNFNLPYLSRNVAEFWRRWHISLSTWLRDYLFIPLGGSRGSRWQTYRNLFITMTLGGLWHGASWTFVIWGMLHGVLLIVHRVFRDWIEPRPILRWLLETLPGTVVRIAFTFICVSLCWVFFQPSLDTALTMFERMFSPVTGERLHELHYRSFWYLFGVLALAHYLVASGVWQKWSPRIPAPLLGACYAFGFNVAMLLSPSSGKDFIYFQF